MAELRGLIQRAALSTTNDVLVCINCSDDAFAVSLPLTHLCLRPLSFYLYFYLCLQPLTLGLKDLLAGHLLSVQEIIWLHFIESDMALIYMLALDVRCVILNAWCITCDAFTCRPIIDDNHRYICSRPRPSHRPTFWPRGLTSLTLLN